MCQDYSLGRTPGWPWAQSWHVCFSTQASSIWRLTESTETFLYNENSFLPTVQSLATQKRAKLWLWAGEFPGLISHPPHLISGWNCISDLHIIPSRFTRAPSPSWLVSLYPQWEQISGWRQWAARRWPGERGQGLAQSKWPKCFCVKAVDRLCMCLCTWMCTCMCVYRWFFGMACQKISFCHP